MNRLSFLKTLFAAPVAAKVLTEQVKAMPEIVKNPAPAVPASRLAQSPAPVHLAPINSHSGCYIYATGMWRAESSGRM
jgi:hypothetical protein